MKKILFIATIPSFLNAFMVNNFKILHELGYEIHAATGSVHDYEDKIPPYVKIHYLSIQRSPFSLKNLSAYKELVQLINSNNIDIIDCHTPVGGALGRLVAHKTRKFCIYTAHGFHFCKGASLINWIVYYPIEKWLSRYTNILITINEEDYSLAKRKFHCPKVFKIPGVGVDTKKYTNCNINRDLYRKSLGIQQNDFVILSVGELSDRKNHSTIIKAIAELNDPEIKYLIVGAGSKEEELKNLICDLKLDNNVFLLGFRQDIPELCHCADIYAFPSKREGLGLAAIEGMASGLPLLSSNVHGINDYSINNVTGYKNNPKDFKGFSNNLFKLYNDKKKRRQIGLYNIEISKKYDISIVDNIMIDIYKII